MKGAPSAAKMSESIRQVSAHAWRVARGGGPFVRKAEETLGGDHGDERLGTRSIRDGRTGRGRQKTWVRRIQG